MTKHSNQVISELTNELAIAILLERRSDDPEKKAMVLIDTIRSAGESNMSDNPSVPGRNLSSIA